MPIDHSDYGPDWANIRNQILVRAGGDPNNPPYRACCEWCGVRNYDVGHRDAGKFVPHNDKPLCSYGDAADFLVSLITPERLVIVVLTIAHINHDVSDNRHENLAALCQKCHNGHDVAYRRSNRARKKRREQTDAGQAEMLVLGSVVTTGASLLTPDGLIEMGVGGDTVTLPLYNMPLNGRLFDHRTVAEIVAAGEWPADAGFPSDGES